MPNLNQNPRSLLRQRLLSQRETFFASAQTKTEALAAHLSQVLLTLQPDCLGVYWPMRCEFNAATPWPVGENGTVVPLALPFAQKNPRALHYRQWDGTSPTAQDDCAIATSNGAPVVPDVLLVPCVGYTAEGHRLGYGGGYFDRYLGAHPHITTVGVAWSVGLITMLEFAPEPHDQTLMVVVTELGVVG
jgi:5-formyltetrahydrofolate cyclo-ligase